MESIGGLEMIVVVPLGIFLFLKFIGKIICCIDEEDFDHSI